MNEIILYFIKVIIGSAFFYGFYKLFMERETHYITNRFFLIVSLLLTIMLPLFQFPIDVAPKNEMFIVMLQTFQIENIKNTEMELISLQNIVIWIYLSGVVLFFVRFIWGLLQLLYIIKNSDIANKNGFRIKITKQKIAPFSFWRTIYINEQEKDSHEIDTILLHESIHIKQNHTIDVLLFEIASILFWFNPFIHLYKKSIKEQHEFIVDEIIKNSKTEFKTYLLLLSHTAGIQLSITNNFNKPLIIKRMKKMTQTPSKSTTHFKLLLNIPLIVGLVILFSMETSNAKNIIHPTNKNNSILVSSDIIQDSIPKNDKKFREVEKPAVFPGGNEQLPIFLGKNIKYPDICREKGIQGIVLVEFLITKEGKIEDVKVIKSIDPLLDQEAIRVIKLMPKWTPAENNGEKVNMIYNLPIRFKLQ